MTTSPGIPFNIVTGPLGVGKTTAILEYLKAGPRDQKTAVLVNDFGTVGLDGELIGGADAVQPPRVQSIPGGCLCCTSGAGFIRGLRAFAEDPAIDRILVEPSGMVVLAQLKDLIRGLMEDLPIQLRSVISLVHPKRMKPAHFESLPFFSQFLRDADVVVAHRADELSPEALAEWMDWARGQLHPEQKLISASHGQIPPEAFDVPSSGFLKRADLSDVQHEHAQRGERVSDPDELYRAEALLQVLHAWNNEHDESLLRFKGLVATPEGWQTVQWAQGNTQSVPARPAARSMMEWILTENADAQAFLEQILTCRIMPIKEE